MLAQRRRRAADPACGLPRCRRTGRPGALLGRRSSGAGGRLDAVRDHRSDPRSPRRVAGETTTVVSATMLASTSLKPEQDHAGPLHRAADVQGLLEAGPVQRAHVRTGARPPHPVVVAVGVQHVVPAQVEPAQLGGEPERAQTAARAHEPVAVARAGDGRARAEDRDVVAAVGQRRGQGVHLVADADLALARQVVGDHRDPQRVVSHGAAPRAAPGASRGRTAGPARGGCPRPTRSTT